jgi:hypothetical protein
MPLRSGPSHFSVLFGGFLCCLLSTRVSRGFPSTIFFFLYLVFPTRSGFDVYSNQGPLVWVSSSSFSYMWWWGQSFEVLSKGMRC